GEERIEKQARRSALGHDAVDEAGLEQERNFRAVGVARRLGQLLEDRTRLRRSGEPEQRAMQLPKRDPGGAVEPTGNAQGAAVPVEQDDVALFDAAEGRARFLVDDLEQRVVVLAA